MKYESLYKLSYKDRENVGKIYNERYNAPDTLRLDLKIGENSAFIVPCSELWELICRIQSVNTRVCLLHRSGELPEKAVEAFSASCLIDEIVTTNDIEGVSSTRREIINTVKSVRNGKRTERFSGLVSKYAALPFGEELSLCNCADIRALYDELVLPEVLEEERDDIPDGQLFRAGEVLVTNAAQKVIHTGLYPEERIIAAMERALDFLNDESVNIFIRISAFHYLFGYIHPFYNGNGRLSRFISSYLLSRELDPLVGFRLSATVRENLSAYYGAFRLCNDRRSMGDITPFIISFLEMLLRAMEELEEALSRRASELQYYSAMIERCVALAERKIAELAELLLQASLFSEEGISTQELMTRCAITAATLNSRLRYLEGLGLLASHMSGREKFHTLRLEALERLAENI